MNHVNPIPIEPRLPGPAIHQACKGLFSRSPVAITSGRFTYSTPNDFGKRLVTLLFATPSKGFTNDFFENIKEVGLREGFEVRPSDPQFKAYMVRDPKLAAADGSILEPTSSSNRDKALDRTFKRQQFLRMHPAVLTKNPIFAGGTIGGVAINGMVWRTVDGLGDRRPRYARSYFEGGDIYFLTNRDQIPKFLVGDDLITATHMVLRMDKWFALPTVPVRDSLNAISEGLFHINKDELNRVFLASEIPAYMEQKAKALGVSLSEEAVLETLKEMQAMGMIEHLAFETDADRLKGKEIASSYLAQRQFVQKEIFATDLRAQPEQIVSFPQIAYHLDFLMTPGPNGSVFLQDYELSVQVLNQIRQNASLLELTPKDLERLESYIALNQVFDKQFKGIMAKAREVLEIAGFTVIPTPGAFFSQRTVSEQAKDKEVFFANVNFLNCLSGYSPKTGHFYMIVPGTHIGDRLGEVLMDTYVEFLNQHCDNLAVYFVGRNPSNPKDFTEAMYCLNRHKSQLGPHCLSFELKTEACTPAALNP